MRYQLSLFLSSYTGGLNQATARELQETADAGGQNAPDPPTKCLRSVRKCFLAVWKMFPYCLKMYFFLVWKCFYCHLDKYFLQFGRIFFSVWKNILFTLGEYCFQFGGILFSVWKDILWQFGGIFLSVWKNILFQFGGEETGTFRKAPPALIAFATVPAFTRLPYHCFKGEFNID